MEVIAENKHYLESGDYEIGNGNFRDLQAVKHCLLEIAEASIDIASHIVAAEGYEKPDDYAGLFIVLSGNDVLDEDLAEKLAEMARFRNLLVHRYGNIEESKLEDFIEEDLKDLEGFSDAVYSYMGE